MSITYSVSLEKLIKEFRLTPIYTPCEPRDILITSADVSRPGLQLNGFFDFFDRSRIQIIGKSEVAFLRQLDKEALAVSCDKFFSYKPPVVIITRGLEPMEELVDASKKYKVPLITTSDATSSFMATLISMLNVELAPRQTVHGVLVEVYGEGILLLGESGVGKSETAIELVKRGHRLIADDAVEIRRVSARSLVGTSPENIRHFVELRGVGIINARRIFGMGAIKLTEKLDMVIQLEIWNKKKIYDRMGIENQYIEILGVSITSLTVPVKPGRNTASIIEVAAMNNREKKMGYNAAQELLEKVGMMDPDAPQSVWDVY